MAEQLEIHLPCNDCGSSDGLSVYRGEDGVPFSLCYVCKKHHNLPSWEEKGTAGHIKKVKGMKLMHRYEEGVNKTLRGIKKETMSFYGARVVGDSLYYPYCDNDGIKGFKVRGLTDKKFFADGQLPELFGQHLFPAGGKTVTITEGEDDAMAAFEMHGSRYACVSVKTGSTGALKDCQEAYDWLDSFESIYIAFDADKPGQDAANKVASLFGEKARIMRHAPGKKDARDYLVAGDTKQFIDRWWQSEAYDPGDIINGADLWERLKAPKVNSIVNYPFEGLNKLTFGIRPGELVMVTSGSGLGKSQFLREVIWEILNKTEEKVGCLFLEESVEKTGLSLMSLAANKPLHLPTTEYTEEEYKEAFEAVYRDRRVEFLEHFGSDSIENIVQRVKHLAKAKDCRFVFLDHISIIVSNQEYGDERKALDEIMTKLRMVVQETGIALIAVSHLKRPEGKGHEEGAVTSLAQLRGSGSIAHLSDIVIGLERNGQAENENERHTTRIRVLKNRFCGLTGPAASAKYNLKTGRMLETVEVADVL